MDEMREYLYSIRFYLGFLNQRKKKKSAKSACMVLMLPTETDVLLAWEAATECQIGLIPGI